jgi:hypothetical protein
MDVTSASSAPPQLSPDGHWWWNGTAWESAAARVEPARVIPAPPAQQAPVQQWPAQQPSVQPAPGWPEPAYGQQAGSGKDGLRMASLICGILWLGGAASVAAVVLGHLSRSRARREGRQASGVALAGLILGYLGSFVGLAAIAIPVFLDQRESAAAAVVKSDLRAVATLEAEYWVDHKTYADLGTLTAQGLTVRPEVVLAVLKADELSFCLGAQSRTMTAVTYYYSPENGLQATPCA